MSRQAFTSIRSIGGVIISVAPQTVYAWSAARTRSRTVTRAFRTDNSGDSLGVAPTCLYRLSHRSLRGAADKLCVLGERPADREGLRRLPGGPPPPQFSLRQQHLKRAPARVHQDAVATFEQSDRATDGGLRRNMSDHEAMAAAGKASIGNQ